MGKRQLRVRVGRAVVMRGLLFAASVLLCGFATSEAGDAAANAADGAARRILAPSGKLRVGLYPGTPTSIMQPDAQSAPPCGVGYELGKEAAARLGVPYEPVVFAKNSEVLDAIKAGRVDMAFTNATAARAKDMDFGPPYLELELGYLIPSDSKIVSIAEIDAVGRRVGVTAASTSDSVLSRELKSAGVVRAATIEAAVEMLNAGQLDAFATNKATLFEMTDKVPGARILDSRWGVERHAIAVPKDREQGAAFIETFTRDVIASGRVAEAMTRAGLRGAIVSDLK